MVKGTHGGKLKDGAGAAASSGSGVAAEASTSTAAMAETSRTAAARRQPPSGVVRRGRLSPSALSVAVFLSKKGKLVRKKAGNASGLNRLGSVLADPCVQSHRFTLAELRKITHDFSDEQLLGEGAFGKVYKGVLQNGDTIAVKRLKLTMEVIHQDKQYENEARHLMRLKHPNIVQLVGYCSATEKKLVRHNGIFVYAEKFERLLCLEYLPKGNLCGHLSDESSGLDWSTRYKIIEGICYGLHYLHEEWQDTPIIHMDLKPANIMLDGNMVPKIADFGLSRLFGEDQTRTCTSNCKGTRGYMAPEYIDKGIITKKLDIFSLGVIIIEIMTGRKDYPLDETETSSQQYIELVLNKWRHRPRKAPGYTSGDIDYEQIKRCIQIGLLCVKKDEVKRPTISQIIKMLDGTEGAEVECIDERKDCTSSNRRTFSSSCPENGTTNAYSSSTPDEAFSSDKLAAQDGDDSDYEVFRVKRRSTIVLEKRCSEDVTTNLTENQVLRRLKKGLKKARSDDRKERMATEVSFGTRSDSLHIKSHCIDSVSGNRDNFVNGTKLKMIHQLDVNTVEDEVRFSQKSNGCSYQPPSVDLGPKRLKIRGPSRPSFPSTISEVQISYRFQEDSDMASQHTQ